MQKKLIALAIAGLAAMPAMADDNVTIYGRVDVGALSRGDGDGGTPDLGTKNEIASGIAAGSRIGFRGTEDLGNGLKALFEVEFGIAVDSGPLTGGASWTNRHSYVGLTGNFGTVVVGRVDGARYGVATKYDPFASGTVANMSGIQRHATRADNAIAYISPRWNGFGFLGAYTTQLIGQENADNTGDVQLYALMAMYDNGPISVTLDYENAELNDISGVDDLDIYVVAGSYDFGVAKAHAYYEEVDGFDGAAAVQMDQKSWMLGVSVPFGKATAKASYTEVENDLVSDGDCDKFGIGVTYSLSKRTSLYADYAKISNDSNAACSIGVSGASGTNPQGATPFDSSSAGYGTRGFDLGIAHTF
jgi:predicted porin